MIRNQSAYTRFDTLRDIVEDNNQMLTVVNRFEISLGFGDATVEKVCRDNDVDTDTFLAVINFMGGKNYRDYPVALGPLIGYLRRSHVHFVNYSLPGIKRILIEGMHEMEATEISMVILQFFDKYMAEVCEHMEFEDSTIFTYVEKLLEGTMTEPFRIADFASSHTHIASKLNDLKDLFIYKYKQRNNERINTALMQLMVCGKDLMQHCEVENELLFPEVQRLEREVRQRQQERGVEMEAPEEEAEMLTVREKEVLRWIAHGLATKEIAERMCLSVHTVNTYRKNIATKLNIHSVAGLSFYAVLHGIIDISEIDLS